MAGCFLSRRVRPLGGLEDPPKPELYMSRRSQQILKDYCYCREIGRGFAWGTSRFGGGTSGSVAGDIAPRAVQVESRGGF